MRLAKARIVAAAEFNAAIRSKAFLVGVILLPIIMVISTLVQRFANKQVDATPRKVAIVDGTGQLGRLVAAAAEARNAKVAPPGGKAIGAPFLVEVVPLEQDADAQRLALSDRVRDKSLFAFVEIPAGVLDPAGQATIQYHSDNPTYEDLPGWLAPTLNAGIVALRLQAAGVDPALVERLHAPVATEELGLLTLGPDGKPRPAAKVDKVRTFLVPLILMYLVFLVVMTSAPQLLSSVIEEKMSKISEVLLGSVTPFELMAGKLLGNAGVSFVLALLYMGGGFMVARSYGYGDVISPGMIAMLVGFLALAVILYGSLYTAIGAACTDFKDAQSLMTPVVMLAVIPTLLWSTILRAPSSPLAIGASLFPMATPFLMLLRVALHPGPPLWQVVAGFLLCGLTTVAAIWASARIFRVGILMSGKSATFAQMARWIVSG